MFKRRRSTFFTTSEHTGWSWVFSNLLDNETLARSTPSSDPWWVAVKRATWRMVWCDSLCCVSFKQFSILRQKIKFAMEEHSKSIFDHIIFSPKSQTNINENKVTSIKITHVKNLRTMLHIL